MFTDLLNKQIELNKGMNDALVSFVNAHDGFIRTDNDIERDTMYAFIFDEELERTTEYRVIAVAVIDGELCVLPDFCGVADLGNMTKEEILEDKDWYSVFGGMCCISPTLYNLCESIEEYVDGE